jgi:hypothetical protein
LLSFCFLLFFLSTSLYLFLLLSQELDFHSTPIGIFLLTSLFGFMSLASLSFDALLKSLCIFVLSSLLSVCFLCSPLFSFGLSTTSLLFCQLFLFLTPFSLLFLRTLFLFHLPAQPFGQFVFLLLLEDPGSLRLFFLYSPLRLLTIQVTSFGLFVTFVLCLIILVRDCVLRFDCL